MYNSFKNKQYFCSGDWLSKVLYKPYFNKKGYEEIFQHIVLIPTDISYSFPIIEQNKDNFLVVFLAKANRLRLKVIFVIACRG